MELPQLMMTRRTLLQKAAGGFGSIALAGMLAEQAAAESTRSSTVDPLAPKAPHFPAKARNVILLFMSGGISHVDSFDPKPRLAKDHNQEITIEYEFGKPGPHKRFVKRANWAFKPYGQAGTEVSDLFPHIGGIMDQACLVRSMSCNDPNHFEAVLALHTGSSSFARPSMGSWLSYGLGTENQNLPSFVVIAAQPTYAGSLAWASDFLPSCHQGTQLVPGGSPIANVARRAPTLDLQTRELELLQAMNREHLQAHSDPALEARIRSFETAFGMQREAPEVFDLSQESDHTLKLYGLQRGETTGFGWQCLVARRLVERGVRFVECIDARNWDSHGDMNDHAFLAKGVDLPIAGLVNDLKQRGLLDDTLVVWATEFGRAPFTKTHNEAGRNHHPNAFSSFLLGAGVKQGIVHGKTDDYGQEVVENRVSIHDFHATILHLLGLDHERLTYRHGGRDFRLTDVAGNVVREILNG